MCIKKFKFNIGVILSKSNLQIVEKKNHKVSLRIHKVRRNDCQDFRVRQCDAKKLL